MKCGQETFKKMTNDNSLTYFPLCINDFHALVFVIKKIKMNEREGFLKYIFYAFFVVEFII
jgi:hypothetical protein